MSGGRKAYQARDRGKRRQAVAALRAGFVDRDVNGPTKPTGREYVKPDYYATGYTEDEGKA